MQNWYLNMSAGQRIFVVLLALIPAGIGINYGGPWGNPWLLFLTGPLLLLIFLALGDNRKPKTE